MLAWYAIYVQIARRLRSEKRAPAVVFGFCGAGGDAEGVRRVNGTGVGVDDAWQPDFVRKFSAEAFTHGDALSLSQAQELRKRSGAIGGMYGPTCKGYSTAALLGSTAEKQIEQVRDLHRQMGWVVIASAP